LSLFWGMGIGGRGRGKKPNVSKRGITFAQKGGPFSPKRKLGVGGKKKVFPPTSGKEKRLALDRNIDIDKSPSGTKTKDEMRLPEN